MNVQRKGLNAVHIVSIPSSLSTTHPELKIEDVLKPGNKADLKVDWERRWDHVRIFPLRLPLKYCGH
jgi:Ser-tRNA(Ala) deacylase AlaX